MSLPQSNAQQDLQIKTVFYAGTNKLQEGMVLVYDTDDTNAPVVTGFVAGASLPNNAYTVPRSLRGRRVIDPGLDVNGVRNMLAGVVAADSAGTTGPAFVDVVVPRKGDVANVYSQVNCVKNQTRLAVGSSAAVNEVQTYTVQGTQTAGSFSLTDALGNSTGQIAWNATPATLATNINTALTALYGANAPVAAVSSAATPMTFTLTFSAGTGAGSPQALFLLETNGLTGATTSTAVRTTPGEALSAAGVNAAVPWVPGQGQTGGISGADNIDLIGVALQTVNNSATPGQCLVRFE